MTTYYVDPAASGSNNGTSWTNAWTSLQSGADTAAAGDIVYCRGTQAIAAAIDFDTNSGSQASGYIKFIGCNASGTNDGTYFNVNGQDNSIDGLKISVNYIWLENIKVYSCNDVGGIKATGYADKCVFVNVWCHDNSGSGLYSNGYVRYGTFSRCRFTNNGSSGVFSTDVSVFVACSFNHNSSYGLNAGGTTICVDCLFHGNGNSGINTGSATYCIGCVFDGNAGHGFYTNEALCFATIGCRFTNNNQAGKYGLGFDGSSRIKLLGCYFGNNTTDITADVYDVLPIDGSIANVVLGGSETDHGYADPTNHDFNLDATKAANTRSVAVELD